MNILIIFLCEYLHRILVFLCALYRQPYRSQHKRPTSAKSHISRIRYDLYEALSSQNSSSAQVHWLARMHPSTRAKIYIFLKYSVVQYGMKPISSITIIILKAAIPDDSNKYHIVRVIDVLIY